MPNVTEVSRYVNYLKAEAKFYPSSKDLALVQVWQKRGDGQHIYAIEMIGLLACVDPDHAIHLNFRGLAHIAHLPFPTAFPFAPFGRKWKLMVNG